jgi:hypothetical protein
VLLGGVTEVKGKSKTGNRCSWRPRIREQGSGRYRKSSVAALKGRSRGPRTVREPSRVECHGAAWAEVWSHEYSRHIDNM